MMRRAFWVWLSLALGFGVGVYQLKLHVQSLEARLGTVNRQILESEESIHVLKAEWSYLNRPERIDALARKYLGFGPLSGKQYGAIAELPLRPPADDAALSQANPAPAIPLPVPAARPAPKAGAITLVKDVR